MAYTHKFGDLYRTKTDDSKTLAIWEDSGDYVLAVEWDSETNCICSQPRRFDKADLVSAEPAIYQKVKTIDAHYDALEAEVTEEISRVRKTIIRLTRDAVNAYTPEKLAVIRKKIDAKNAERRRLQAEMFFRIEEIDDKRLEAIDALGPEAQEAIQAAKERMDVLLPAVWEARRRLSKTIMSIGIPEIG